MKCKAIVLAAALVAIASQVAAAQTDAAASDNDFRGRLSLGADWKIVRKLHLDAGYELRAKDNFSAIDRHQLNLGLEYSPIKQLSISAGYNFIGSPKTSGFNVRHRVHTDLTGSCRFGAWKLSLRERLLLTHNTGDFNRFQKTPNLLELKSRLKIAYKGFLRVEPYAFVELRNCFNAPSFSADYNTTTGKYTNYQFLGYSDSYINRIRGALGTKWELTRHHAINFEILADWCRSKEIDTNAEGTKLKSYQWSKGFRTSLVVGYCFSF